DLRIHRKLLLADVARRSGPRQRLAAGPDAGRPVAEVCKPAALVRLHVVAPWQEAVVHGRRIWPMAGVEPRRVAPVAPSAVAVAPRRAAIPGRPQRFVQTGASAARSRLRVGGL